MLRILVVDDVESMRLIAGNFLKVIGAVEYAVDGLEAWKKLITKKFDLLIADIEMPNLNGMDLTLKIRGDFALRNLPIILITSEDNRYLRELAQHLRVDGFITKPYTGQILLEKTQNILNKRNKLKLS